MVQLLGNEELLLKQLLLHSLVLVLELLQVPHVWAHGRGGRGEGLLRQHWVLTGVNVRCEKKWLAHVLSLEYNVPRTRVRSSARRWLDTDWECN